ncbi:hypothetical protein Pmani_034296 [Petrolisthes manimaculis]|uniref:Uncharacterized protein n=1 Tax=Petrolisthes manimaculis TaxID=1843537 RepID=A0AAE1NMT3_9EUCA|nr:hypothetical protein Pmani_034296 [Petrolisthes manimaculis]
MSVIARPLYFIQYTASSLTPTPTDNTMLNVPVPVPGSLQHNIGQTSPHLTRQEGCLLSRHSPRSGQVISFGPESPSGHLFLSRVTFTVPRP